MRRLFSILFLTLLCSVSAWATQITVQSHTINGYQYTDAAPKIRIYVSQSFLSSDGESVIASPVGSASFYRQISCTANVSTDVLTIPAFTLPSTVDGSPNTARYSFVLYTGSTKRETLYSNMKVPTSYGTSITVAQWITDNQLAPNPPRPGFPDVQQVQTLINSTIATQVVDGSTAVKGKVRFATDGESTALEAVQSNDNRLVVPTGVANDDFMQRKGGLWVNRTVLQVKTDLGVDLINNTPDSAKPISTAAQSALDLKAPILSPTFTGTVSGITKVMVGLPNADDTSDLNKPISTLTQNALDLKANESDVNAALALKIDNSALADVATSGLASDLEGFDSDPALSDNSATKIPSQSAVKSYVDNAALGLEFKASVRVATTVNGTLATAYEAGDTLDGVPLLEDDRILIKNQTTKTENGIYIVEASGAPTRSTDADTGAELLRALVSVDLGTHTGEIWRNDNTSAITIGVSLITFEKFSSAVTVSAGSGIDVSANQVSIETAGVTNAMLAGSISPSKVSGTAATLAGSESLTNKTLVTPTIASFANAAHAHTNAVGGGQLSLNSFSSTTGTGAVVGASDPIIDQPVFTTRAQTPILVGGSDVTSSLRLRSTSGAGATGADIIFQVGNGGGTEAMRITNDSRVGFGTASPLYQVHLKKNLSGNPVLMVVENSSNTSASDARVVLIGGGTSGGDLLTIYDNNVGSQWWSGMDVSDAAKYKIGTGALGSADKFVIGTDGTVTIPGNLVINGTCLAGGVSCSGGGGGGSSAFNAITAGTNTAALVVGTGGSLGVSGSGTINATSLNGATFAAPGAIGGTTPAAGTFTTGTFTTIAGSGASVTNLNASNLASGTVPTARLGSGSASSSTYLRGDQTWATIIGGGDILSGNNGSDFANIPQTFTNLKQNATASVTGVVQVSKAPASGNPIATETTDTRISTATGARKMHVSQKAGATLGAKVAAAITECGASPCHFIIEVNGTELWNQRNTFPDGATISFEGSGTVTSTLAGHSNAYIVMGNNSTMQCSSKGIVLQESSAASNFKIVVMSWGVSDNANRGGGVTIRGCKFQGLARVGDGAQGMVDLGNCQNCKFIDNEMVDATAITLQIGGTSVGLGSKTITNIAAPSGSDHGSGVITTSTAHGAVVGDRVVISGVTTPTKLNSYRGSFDVVTNGTTTITSATLAFTADDVGQLVILFKDIPAIVTPVVIVGYTNATTVTVNATIPAATGVQAEMPLTQGAAWIVKTVPSTTTLTVENAPTQVGTCSSCTGTLYVAHDARDVEVSGNKFFYNSLADVAPVNARKVVISNNLFGPRRLCTSGSWIDMEPNRYTDSSTDMVVTGNLFDARGSACFQPTAWGGISMGSASGRTENVLITSNSFRAATLGPGLYAGGNLTRDSFQLQQAVHIWQARDVTISNNQIEGYYNFAIEMIGYGPTDRMFVNGNRFLGDGNLVRLVNTRYSHIINNTYEHRNWNGGTISEPVVAMIEVDSGGRNVFANNIGVTNYTLVAGGGSFIKDGAKGADVASATSITPTGSSFTVTGTTQVETILATGVGVTAGTVLQMITSSALTFGNSGNLTFQAAATSLTTSANDLVTAVWDGTKWRVR